MKSSKEKNFPEAITQKIQAKTWKVFNFASEYFLLHIPSVNLFQVTRAIAEAAKEAEAIPLKSAQKVSTVTQGPVYDLAKIETSLPKDLPRKLSEQKIKVIALNVAQHCNLACSYCYAGSGDYGSPAFMTNEVAFKALEYFSKDVPELTVVFFGGEPLLNFDLIKDAVLFCQTIREKGSSCVFKFRITTNGTLFTTEILRFFRLHRFSISVSYDGDGLQDRQRCFKHQGQLGIPRGTESLLQDVLKLLHEWKAGFERIQLRATLVKENLAQFESMLKSTLQTKRFPIALTPITSSDTKDIFKQADIRSMEDILRSVINDFISIKDYDAILQLTTLREKMTNLHRAKRYQMYCGAGQNYCSMSASGGCYLCHRFTEQDTGYIGDLTVGLDDSKLKKILKIRLFQGLSEDVPCPSCWMRHWCAGGCFHQNVVTQGGLLRPDPLYCLWLDMEYRLAMEVYAHFMTRAASFLGQL